MTDETATEPAPGDPEKPEPGPLVASYQARVHLRRENGQNLEPLTIEQFKSVIAAPLAEIGYSVSITAERLDI